MLFNGIILKLVFGADTGTILPGEIQKIKKKLYRPGKTVPDMRYINDL